jgi:AcrR family transcriptional regulator
VLVRYAVGVQIPASASHEPGLRARKKRETWQAIRTAALALFAERGFDAVSVTDIAAAANVARGTFFNYFPSKEAVVVNYGAHEAEFQRQLMDQRPSGEPLWGSMVAIILGYLDEFEAEIVTHLRLKAGSPTLARSARPMTDRLVADLRDWGLQRHPHFPEPDLMLVIQVAVTTLATAVHYWPVDAPAASRITTVRLMLDRVATGLAHQPDAA